MISNTSTLKPRGTFRMYNNNVTTQTKTLEFIVVNKGDHLSCIGVQSVQALGLINEQSNNILAFNVSHRIKFTTKGRGRWQFGFTDSTSTLCTLCFQDVEFLKATYTSEFY